MTTMNTKFRILFTSEVEENYWKELQRKGASTLLVIFYLFKQSEVNMVKKEINFEKSE